MSASQANGRPGAMRLIHGRWRRRPNRSAANPRRDNHEQDQQVGRYRDRTDCRLRAGRRSCGYGCSRRTPGEDLRRQRVLRTVRDHRATVEAPRRQRARGGRPASSIRPRRRQGPPQLRPGHARRTPASTPRTIPTTARSRPTTPASTPRTTPTTARSRPPARAASTPRTTPTTGRHPHPAGAAA